MMNKAELKQKLVNSRVPENLFNLEETGRTDERFCLKQNKNGWSVYFSERGVKTTNVSFVTEEEACEYIYRQLVN